MAKKQGVPGWHSMRKEQLVSALLKLATERAKDKTKDKKKPTRAAKKPGSRQNGSAAANARSESRVSRIIREERLREENLKNLALANSNSAKKAEPTKDRVVLIVRDSYWIQAYWEITKQTVARARVALADAWHDAKPVLRLLELSDSTPNSVENIVREIPIHGGVRNWYIDVKDPPKPYRVALGYAVDDGRFHLISKSNCVSTPASETDNGDDNWVDIKADYEKYYAMSGGYELTPDSNELQFVFENKLRRPLSTPAFVRLGSGIGGTDNREFPFEVDSQLIIFGSTDPEANVSLGGEPVKIKEDGTFSVRMGLPDRRQVLPVVACSRDGTEQRTIVLAIERNTKVMEPISRDFSEVE